MLHGSQTFSAKWDYTAPTKKVKANAPQSITRSPSASGRENCSPVPHDFSGSEVDAQCAEVCGARLLRRAGVHVASPRNLEVGEPGSHDRGFQLCL